MLGYELINEVKKGIGLHKIKHIVFLIFLFSSNLHADDQWLCKEEASLRQGNSILACGVGTGADENTARSTALDNAMAEFKKICDSSADCKGRKFTIDPKRMTCSRVLDEFKCYRLIAYNIDETQKQTLEQITTTDNPGVETHKRMIKEVRRDCRYQNPFTQNCE